MTTRNGPVVLVVEDDPAVLRSLKFSLELEGYNVEIYSTPSEVLGSNSLPRAGCLIIDYWLPEMNGLDLLNELRLRGVETPAILMTSYPSPALRDRSAAAGILRLVEKPLLGNALLDSIHEALGRTAGTAA